MKCAPSETQVEWGYTKQMYYVYILLLGNRKYYSGYSENLKQRVKEHKSARVSATKTFFPIKLVFYAAFKSKLKALRFEKYLKSHSGFAFRNKRLT